MHVARSNHSATLLPDGRVLVVGGRAGLATLKSVELFDPATQAWTEAAPLHEPRFDHVAVLLGDGRVLVVGGGRIRSDVGEIVASAELFDPAAGTWTSAGTPIGHSYGAGAGVALPDGGALVHAVIERAPFDLVSILERFDPASRTWTRVERLPEARIRPSMAALPGGRVLVAGGSSARSELPSPLADAWAYDPATDQLTSLPDMPDPGFGEPAITLADGRVLVPAGQRVDIFDPAANAWSRSSRAAGERDGQVAGLLPDGLLIVAGSQSCHDGDDSTEVYDPETNRWRSAGPIFPYQSITITVLRDGAALLAGGSLPCDDRDGTFGPFDTAFVLDPAAIR